MDEDFMKLHAIHQSLAEAIRINLAGPNRERYLYLLAVYMAASRSALVMLQAQYPTDPLLHDQNGPAHLALWAVDQLDEVH